MPRRALTVAVLAATTGLLAACGGDEPSGGTADTAVGGESGANGVSGAAEGSAGSDTAHGGAGASAGDARHVEVAARSFAFEPDEITVGSGEDVAIVLVSEDDEHDFTVDGLDGLDGLDAQVVAEPGEEGFGMFRAGEPGRYTFYCSVEGHREAGMEGVLVVEG